MTDGPGIDGVSKRYGEVVALRGMTFDVRAGELYGFVGSNGAGKTTAMREILRVLTPDAGEVRWAGRQSLRRDRTCVPALSVSADQHFSRPLRARPARRPGRAELSA